MYVQSIWETFCVLTFDTQVFKNTLKMIVVDISALHVVDNCT